MATAYDTANIIIPKSAGYKAGSLYGWNPQGGSLVDFAVTRAGATATRVNEAGLIESVAANVPRMDWAEGGSCPSLLVEPQRTNLFTYSEDFSTDWNDTRSAITTNQSTSPDGTINADLFKGDGSSTSNPIIGKTITFSTAGTYVVSIYAKYTNNQWINIRPIAYTGSTGEAYFDIQNGVLGTVSGVGASIENAGNGWYRCSVVITIDAGDLAGVINYYLASADNSTSYSSVGDQLAANAYIWGAQLESGAYATSYIPTTGTTETRNADVIQKTGIASLLGQSAGTFNLEFLSFNTTATGLISLSDGTFNNIVNLGFTGGNSFSRIRAGGSLQVNNNGSAVANNTYVKAALRYATNDFALYANGIADGTDSSVTTFSDGTLNQISFDDGAGNLPFFGRLRVGLFYDYALDNTELANLTTP